VALPFDINKVKLSIILMSFAYNYDLRGRFLVPGHRRLIPERRLQRPGILIHLQVRKEMLLRLQIYGPTLSNRQSLN